MMSDISANLDVIRNTIGAAAVSAGREPGAIKLMAVSKGHDASAVRAALAAGQRCFGENRVQEAKAKFVSLKTTYPDLVLHLIGPLQTNKAGEAVMLFDVIETLDRPSLADGLAKAIKKTGRAPKFLIEINIGGEVQKAGIAPSALSDFLTYCRAKGLMVGGLMCIPPQNADPTPHFLRLKELATQYGLNDLSMGMSDDFETAIRCGSTEVRVGTAIFGPR